MPWFLFSKILSNIAQAGCARWIWVGVWGGSGFGKQELSELGLNTVREWSLGQAGVGFREGRKVGLG